MNREPPSIHYPKFDISYPTECLHYQQLFEIVRLRNQFYMNVSIEKTYHVAIIVYYVGLCNLDVHNLYTNTDSL